MLIHRLADVRRRFSRHSPVIKIPVTSKTVSYTGWEVDFRGHVLHNSSVMAGRKTAHCCSSSAALAGSHVMSQLRSAEGVGAVLTHCVDTAALIFQGERASYMFVQFVECFFFSLNTNKQKNSLITLAWLSRFWYCQRSMKFQTLNSRSGCVTSKEILGLVWQSIFRPWWHFGSGAVS